MSSNMHRAQLPGTGEMRRVQQLQVQGWSQGRWGGAGGAAAEWRHLSLASSVVTLGQWSFNFVKALRI